MKNIQKLLWLLVFSLSASLYAANWNGSTREPESTKKIDGKVFYVITSAEELAWFAAQVNSGKTTINAQLANDIKFMDDTSKIITISWTPIGKDSTVMFSGIFDGAGWTIYGLYSDRIGALGPFGGLFGVTDEIAVVKSVKLKMFKIRSTRYAGGVVAVNNGTVSDCMNDDGSVETISSTGNVGGIVGRNYGSITGCASSSFVSSGSKPNRISTGGIAGWNFGSITDCTNSGAVSFGGFYYWGYAGGIAGRNSGTVARSTNDGLVSFDGLKGHSGGIVGLNSGSVSDCRNLGRMSTTDSDRSGGLVGENEASKKIVNSFSVANSAKAGIVYENNGTVSNSYYDSDILTGLSTVDANLGMQTSEMQSNRFAWILNTTNGSTAHSGVWSRDSMGYPIFADSLHRPIYKIIFAAAGVMRDYYTDYRGLVIIPPDPEVPEGKIFGGWYTSTGVKVKESTVFTYDQPVIATYIDSSDIYFSIRFFDSDTTLLDSQNVQYGKTPSYAGTPTKASTAQYTYAFEGWHVEPTAATEDFDYYAVYTETLNAYVVRFLDYDGTELQSSSYLYGATPGMSPNPTRESTVAYDYTFAGWTPAVAKVTKSADYTALYDSSKVVYTVTFMNGSEEFARVQTPYGEAAAAPNPSPSRSDYKFVGWSKSLTNVTSDMTVLALFEELVYHNITISRGDGEDETIRVEEDSLFTLPAAPEKDGHRFVGWYDADGNFLGNAGDTIRIQVDIQIVAHFEALSSSSVVKSSSSSLERSSSSEAKSSSSSVEKSSSSKEVTGILAQAPVRAWTVTAVGRTFQIHAAPVGKPYALFDLQGKVLATGRVESSEMTVSVPRAGSFVVRIGRNTVRMNAK